MTFSSLHGSDRPAIRVRPFAPADREFVLSLAYRLLIGIPPWRNPETMLHTAEGWLRDSMDQHRSKSWVVVAEDPPGERLGFATVEHSKHFTGMLQAELGELVVREDAEGRGVGQALVATCSDWARAQGYRFLALGSGMANTRARRLYQQLAFLEEDVRLVQLLGEDSAKEDGEREENQ